MATGEVSSYLTGSALWCDGLGNSFENIGRFLTTIESGAQIGVAIHAIHNRTHDGLNNFKEAINVTGAMVSSFRFISSLERLVTGKVFWERSEKTGIVDGDPIKKGQFLTDSDDRKIWRDPIDVIQDIVLLVARFFSGVFQFHKLRLYDLGKHANWVGHVILGTFAAVTTIGVIKSIKDCIGVKAEDLRKAIVEIFSNFFDLLAFPNDAGLIGFSNPIISLVGAILSFLAAGFYLLKEWVYFNP